MIIDRDQALQSGLVKTITYMFKKKRRERERERGGREGGRERERENE